ncbi:hypothetical protein [Roseivirga spongicola]|uniref:Glycine zipper domain-containing protein n=1 Tax=Roseivirga spongicola TaxID=333140 RepID=A0A150XFQ2_9BACT|nr:hypothetical protein [Roseivirga spongicola]KYG77538.1 hypothetical protein AWW68_01840 [Roseivirga spongicola]WPZ11248.1 hypothetical protein T7867_03920 [Roseivirga spongicola]
MKLYVEPCASCGQKIYLNKSAENRSELRRLLGSDRFHLSCAQCGVTGVFSVNEVKAESEAISSVAGGIVGGLIGILGGPAGILIGGSIGAAIGSSSDREEIKKVNFFNHSI